MPLSVSDHCPILIEVCSQRPQFRKKKRLVRFEEGWFEIEECMEIIKQEWATPTTGNALQQIAVKCKAMGVRLIL